MSESAHATERAAESAAPRETAAPAQSPLGSATKIPVWAEGGTGSRHSGVDEAEARSVIEVMERGFGVSFGGVRLRNDGLSAARAAGLGALAYTDGSEVGFGAGSFTPRSREGLRTIAHEFAHVAQSRAGLAGAAAPDRDSPGPPPGWRRPRPG